MGDDSNLPPMKRMSG
jgi:hypothetical protein